MFRTSLRYIKSRNFSSPTKVFPSYEQTMLKKAYAERTHAVKTTNMWFWFNIVFTAPALIACSLYTVPAEMEHLGHLREHPNEFVGYSYLRKRSKPEFPWGSDNSLFHSDHANARPE